ncbi:MAG: DUF2721 domain-containing protein [Planctomycetota bacterium]|nr:DUF2721 domain-containing protein [Planctomycetota bacterium]
MEPTELAHSPFAALTFIAAPALLTNASSVLALSTTNRMLRTRDQMRELYLKSEAGSVSAREAARHLNLVSRVERQATLIMGALYSIYVALAAFASSTLVTLLGVGLEAPLGSWWLFATACVGVALGFIGVGGLVKGCVNLLRATNLSLLNIHEEAGLIREGPAPSGPKT